MDLDQFKSGWQAAQVPATEEKDMTQIKDIVATNVGGMLKQQINRQSFTMLRMIALAVIVTIGFYSMSDGFTDDADPLGALFVLLALFLSLFFAGWWRQRTLFALALGSDMQSNLLQSIRVLKRNQLLELCGVVLLFLAVIAGCVILLTTTPRGLFVALLLLPIILFSGLIWTVWQRSQRKLNELNDYLEQLNEALS